MKKKASVSQGRFDRRREQEDTPGKAGAAVLSLNTDDRRWKKRGVLKRSSKYLISLKKKEDEKDINFLWGRVVEVLKKKKDRRGLYA